jgi:hypothetical protein
MEEQALRMAEMRNAYRILVEEPEGKTPIARPRGLWKRKILHWILTK